MLVDKHVVSRCVGMLRTCACQRVRAAVPKLRLRGDAARGHSRGSQRGHPVSRGRPALRFAWVRGGWVHKCARVSVVCVRGCSGEGEGGVFVRACVCVREGGGTMWSFLDITNPPSPAVISLFAYNDAHPNSPKVPTCRKRDSQPDASDRKSCCYRIPRRAPNGAGRA